jgi:hypothetical protein
MSIFETSAIVEDHGQIRVAGVPFAVGTQVQVSISPKVRPDEASADVDSQALATARARMQELFRTIKGFRMAPRISREDLYDRRCLR